MTCPRCGAEGVISTEQLTGSPLGAESDLVMCETCEFVWPTGHRKRKNPWPGGHRRKKRST